MGESYGVQFGVAEHFLQLGLLEGAVDGGVDVFLRWREARSGQWGGIRGGTGLGGGAYLLGRAGGLTSSREPKSHAPTVPFYMGSSLNPKPV